MPIGQRIVDRYIKHPPASSGDLADGDPLDSGSAAIVHSNLSSLAKRNVRLIGHAPGLGNISYASTITDPWARAFDLDQPAAPEPYEAITWERPATAVLFGPVALAHTRTGTAPAGHYPRRIRVVIQAHKSSEAASNLRLMAALTLSPDTPALSPRIAQATAGRTQASAGAWLASLDLDCDAPVRPTQVWRCRADGTSEATLGAVTPAWVWVGWYTNTVTTLDRIESVSAFEVYA